MLCVGPCQHAWQAQNDVGFGTIVGSAVFNVLFVIGLCPSSSRARKHNSFKAPSPGFGVPAKLAPLTWIAWDLNQSSPECMLHCTAGVALSFLVAPHCLPGPNFLFKCCRASLVWGVVFVTSFTFYLLPQTQRCGYVAKGNIELTWWPLFRDRFAFVLSSFECRV